MTLETPSGSIQFNCIYVALITIKIVGTPLSRSQLIRGDPSAWGQPGSGKGGQERIRSKQILQTCDRMKHISIHATYTIWYMHDAYKIDSG